MDITKNDKVWIVLVQKVANQHVRIDQYIEIYLNKNVDIRTLFLARSYILLYIKNQFKLHDDTFIFIHSW